MSTTTEYLGLIKPELKDPANITNLNWNWEQIDRYIKSNWDACNDNVESISDLLNKYYELYKSVSALENKSIHYSRIKLNASQWQGTTAPYTYTLTGYDDKTVEVLEDVIMTMEQLEALENAKIKSDPSSNEHILYAFGEKPTIDLPVLIGIHY